MERRDLTNRTYQRLLGAYLSSVLGAMGCSATTSTSDWTPARLDARRPNGIALSTTDTGSASLTQSTSTASLSLNNIPAAIDSGTPEATATLLPGATARSLDPLLDRSYRLPLGDTLTTRKAMATKYADLTPGNCRAEVRRRHLPIVAVKSALGIVDPMRLTGALRGIRFVTPGPKSVHGLLDCRLVLLLDELSGVLASEGVTTVYVDGLYRPKAHLPGKKALSQHALGLAIDIHSFGTKDGRTLVIERDFAGSIGSPVCGETATVQPESKDSVVLRNIVCAMARAKAFHYLLTPNHDPSHANHIHGDINRGAQQHVIR